MNEILLLSSDPDFRQKNIEFLSQNGFTVVDSSNSSDGLSKIEERSFDIVIIDEALSDGNSYEACQKIRQQSNIPIILTGTEPYSEVQDKPAEANFNLYMTKPVDSTELVTAIKAIIIHPSSETKQTYDTAKDTEPAPDEHEKTTSEKPDTGVTPAETTDENRKIPEYKPLTPDMPVSPYLKKQRESGPLIPKPVIPDRASHDKTVTSEKQPPKSDVNTIFCTTCGHPNDKSLRFCSYCGRKLTRVSSQPSISKEEEYEEAVMEDTPEENVPDDESAAEEKISEQEPVINDIPEENIPDDESTLEKEVIQQEPVTNNIPEKSIPADESTAEEKVSEQEPVINDIPEENVPSDEFALEREVIQQEPGMDNAPEEKVSVNEAPIEEVSSKKEPVMKNNPYENVPPAESFPTEIKSTPAAPIILKETPSFQSDSSDTSSGQDASYQNGTFQIWEDGRAIKLVEALVLGKINDINPIIDLGSKDGFSYPQVNEIIDSNDEDTNHTLQFLEKANILIKKPYEKLLMDPDGTFQLMPQERCPNCDSANLISGQLVEHFACGYVGMEQDFKVDHKYICPKCHRDMKLIGTDYRNAGIHYRCLSCNEVFPNPIIKWRSLNSHKVWNANELKHVWVYSYSFSPEKKEWLEFQLKPKTQLIEFLKNRGYEVQESAQLSGSSGAVHTIDILAVRDDIMTRINLGIGILVAMPGEHEVQLEELFKYDTRAYDIGINYKVVIAIPKLNAEAIKFAERQVIGTFEARTLGSLVAHITSQTRSADSIIAQGGEQVSFDIKQIQSKSDAASILIRFLRKRGYEVFENAKIIGKSGAEYVFDIIARREDGIVVPTIAIDMAVLPAGQEVDINEISQFDSEVYDAGIRNKVFVGIPGISRQAIQFAHQQRIRIIEANDLQKYM